MTEKREIMTTAKEKKSENERHAGWQVEKRSIMISRHVGGRRLSQRTGDEEKSEPAFECWRESVAHAICRGKDSNQQKPCPKFNHK